MARATAIAIVIASTLVGAAIRLAITQGLSVDEITAVDHTQLSLGGLISYLAHSGVQPPLHPFLEWCAVRLVGDGDLAVRLPAIIAGVALIPVVAWLARELFDRQTAVMAALITAVAPLLVWYSQQASDYELVALFGTVAVLGAVRSVQRTRPFDWATYTVGAALAVWSDWSGIFIVVATELVLLLAVVRRARAGESVRHFLVGWGLATLALACQLTPLGLLFADQWRQHGGLAGIASVGASGVSFYTAVSNGAWALFGFQPGVITTALAAVWPLAMLASLVLIGRGVGTRGWLLITCAVVPALGTLVLGLAVPSAFDVRYAIAGIVPFLVLLARMATGWPRGRAGRSLVAIAILVVLVGALADQQIAKSNPRRYDYRAAVAEVERDTHPGAVIFYTPAELRVVVARDAPGLHASRLSKQLPTRAQASSVILLTSFTSRPAVRALLNRDLGALRATRRLLDYQSYPGVEVWWFR